MESNLEARSRDTFGKNAARRTRAAGWIPAVVYGGHAQGERPVGHPISVDPKALYRILHSDSGVNTLIGLKVDDAEGPTRVLVREYQLDPVTHALLHADFYRVAMDKLLTVTVPIVLRGEAQGVKLQGGVVDFVSRDIEVECLPADIPDEIVVDFSGTSGQVAQALNATLPITKSYTMYALKCLLNPAIPNNEGAFLPVRVEVPEGSILNARWPAPTWGRTIIIHYIPEVIFFALADAVPDKVIGGSGSIPLWYGNMAGQRRDGRPFLTVIAHQGGLGATAAHDGVSCLSFPGNVSNIPVEIAESDAPVVYIANTTTQPGQTDELGLAEHVRTVLHHLGGRGLDVALLNADAPPAELREHYSAQGLRYLEPTENELGAIRALGVDPVLAPLIDTWSGPRRLWEKLDTIRHDADRVGDALVALVRERRRPRIEVVR